MTSFPRAVAANLVANVLAALIFYWLFRAGKERAK